jgi:hypothetical protein
MPPQNKMPHKGFRDWIPSQTTPSFPPLGAPHRFLGRTRRSARFNLLLSVPLLDAPGQQMPRMDIPSAARPHNRRAAPPPHPHGLRGQQARVHVLQTLQTLLAIRYGAHAVLAGLAAVDTRQSSHKAKGTWEGES